MSSSPLLRASGPVLRGNRRDPGPRFCPGAVLGDKYQLVRQLGEGGMGDVWVAHHLVLNVHVALKVMATDGGVGGDAVAAERMRQEARAAAQLGHPAICRLLDFGRTEVGEPYLVHELLHGDTLRGVLELQQQLSPIQALRIMLPVVDALALAHAQGIVHRDVKPENVFLSRDMTRRLQPKLLDFGIARFVEADERLTLDGSVLGTPVYMSPEQARGDPNIDARTDVWAVCVVLYEAMTGTVPFQGNNYNAVLWAVATGEPRSTLEQEVGDEALWLLLEKGLRKDREQRWQSVRELGEALALWLYERGVREDICGGLLRATWLETGLSDIQVELPPSSRAPGLHRSPPEVDPRDRLTPIRIRRPVRPMEPPGADTLRAPVAAAPVDRRKHARLWAGIGLSAAVVSAAALWGSRGSRSSAVEVAAPRVDSPRPEARPAPTRPTDPAPAASLPVRVSVTKGSSRPSPSAAPVRKAKARRIDAHSSPAAVNSAAGLPSSAPSKTSSSTRPREQRPVHRERRAPRYFGF